MAKGEPPLSELHPMRVLFLIPKNEPPELSGNFSRDFKEFVAACLQKEPSQRPSAADLLKHKFFKNSKKTSALIPLIEKSKNQKDDDSSSDSEPNQESSTPQQNKDKFWSFGDTLKPEGKFHLKSNLLCSEQEIAKKQVQEAAAVEEKKESRRKREHGSKSTASSSSKSRRYDIVMFLTNARRDRSERGEKGDKDKEHKKRKRRHGDKKKSKPTALTSFIFPALDNVSAQTKDDRVIASLQHLKTTFENAERLQPGVTHALIAAIIDTLKNPTPTTA